MEHLYKSLPLPMSQDRYVLKGLYIEFPVSPSDPFRTRSTLCLMIHTVHVTADVTPLFSLCPYGVRRCVLGKGVHGSDCFSGLLCSEIFLVNQGVKIRGPFYFKCAKDIS